MYFADFCEINSGTKYKEIYEKIKMMPFGWFHTPLFKKWLYSFSFFWCIFCLVGFTDFDTDYRLMYSGFRKVWHGMAGKMVVSSIQIDLAFRGSLREDAESSAYATTCASSSREQLSLGARTHSVLFIASALRRVGCWSRFQKSRISIAEVARFHATSTLVWWPLFLAQRGIVKTQTEE